MPFFAASKSLPGIPFERGAFLQKYSLLSCLKVIFSLCFFTPFPPFSSSNPTSVGSCFQFALKMPLFFLLNFRSHTQTHAHKRTHTRKHTLKAGGGDVTTPACNMENDLQCVKMERQLCSSEGIWLTISLPLRCKGRNLANWRIRLSPSLFSIKTNCNNNTHTHTHSITMPYALTLCSHDISSMPLMCVRGFCFVSGG